MDASAANPNNTRWTDGPPSLLDDGPGSFSEKRPASSLSEPVYKKARPDYSQELSLPVYTGGPGAYLEQSVLDDRSTASLGQIYASYNNNAGDQSYGTVYGGNVSGSYSQNQKPAGSFAPGSAKGSGTGALFYKTKLCTKFKLGSCTFNERCHFAHGVEDLRKPPPGWEDMVKMTANGTSMEAPRRSNKPCRYFLEGSCPYGEKCTFSHGNDDGSQRSSVSVLDVSSGSGLGSNNNNGNASTRANFKTRLCARWEKGEVCKYGDKCHFAHGQADLRSYAGGSNNYSTTGMSDSTNYSDSVKMNHSSLSDNYGLSLSSINYGNIAGGASVPTSNISSYSSMTGSMNPYATSQAGQNGYSTNYNNYSNWNSDSKVDNVSPPVSVVSTMPIQGYVQSASTASWSGNYNVDSGYERNATSTGNCIQGMQNQQSHPYYVNLSNFQNTNHQNLASVQDGSQSNCHNGTKNMDGSSCYSSTYTGQQSGYVTGYNPV